MAQNSVAVGSTSGGKVYGYNNISTGAEVVAPLNTGRQRITFHNPGAVDIFVGPVLLQTTGMSLPYALSTASIGGSFRVFANGGQFTLEGECQGSWQAISASGVGNPLTVVDSNV